MGLETALSTASSTFTSSPGRSSTCGPTSRRKDYTGATLASFVEGKGLTCDAPPAGYVRDGLAGGAQQVPRGLYAHYRQG